MSSNENKNSLFAGILMIAAMGFANIAYATSCTSNDDTAPCFSDNGDILAGSRDLLPDDDLHIITRTNPSKNPKTLEFFLHTSNLSVSHNREAVNGADCDPIPQSLSQGLIGRFFALPNDLVVTMRRDSKCENLLIQVQDEVNSGNDSKNNFYTGVSSPGDLNYAGIAKADFNLDSYQDIFFIDDALAQVYTAKCTGDPFVDCTDKPSAGFVKGPESKQSQTGPYASPPVTGDFNGDGFVDIAWASFDGGENL